MGFFWPYYHQNTSMPIPIPSKPRRLEKMPQQLEITFSAEMIMTFIRFCQKIVLFYSQPIFLPFLMGGLAMFTAFMASWICSFPFTALLLLHFPIFNTMEEAKQCVCMHLKKAEKKSSFSSSQIGSPLGLLFHE